MFNGGDDDIFDLDPDLADFYPDIDGDGKSTLLDYLEWEDIFEEEERELNKHLLDNEDDEVGIEHLFDEDDEEDLLDEPEDDNYDSELSDYKIEKEYDGYLDRTADSYERVYDEDDFADEDIYEENDDYSGTESGDYEYGDNKSQTYNVTITLSLRKERPRLVKDYDIENTSGIVYLEGREIRKAAAKKVLEAAANKTFKGDKRYIKRSNFIVYSDTVAAKYMTVDGYYLFTQAIKDHFRLPFAIPDETDSIKIGFIPLLSSLYDTDVQLTFKIWDWVLETFQPYLRYARNKKDLTNEVMVSSDFQFDFSEAIIDHMEEKPEFIERFVQYTPEEPFGIEFYIVEALNKGKPTIARDIMECAFANESVDSIDKYCYIDRSIEECKVFETKLMDSFSKYVFPIVYTEKDKEISSNIDRWIAEMNKYIVKPKKIISQTTPVKRDIEPNKLTVKEQVNTITNTNTNNNPDTETEKMYSYCRVRVGAPWKPLLYYFTGGLKIDIGDHVIVPLSEDNTETEAFVVGIGERIAKGFPCPFEKIKTVIRVVR